MICANPKILVAFKVAFHPQDYQVSDVSPKGGSGAGLMHANPLAGESLVCASDFAWPNRVLSGFPFFISRYVRLVSRGISGQNPPKTT